METRQAANTRAKADVAVDPKPIVGSVPNEPNDGLLGDFGCGRSFSQVKGPMDHRPDPRPWDENVEGDVGSQSRSSCFIAPSGYHNNHPARSEGSGDGKNVDDCASTLRPYLVVS